MQQVNDKNKKIIMAAIAVIILVGVMIVVISARGFKGDNIDKGEAVATSTYGKVYKSEVEDALELMSAQAGGTISYDSLNEEQLKTVVGSIIAQRAVLQDAKQSAVVQDAKFQKALQSLKENLIKETYLRDLASKQITEEKMKERYDAVRKEIEGQKEYGVRHILFNTKAEADKASATLTKLNFSSVAKKESKDKGSAVNGGDLGMVLLKALDSDFAEQVAKQPVGRISKPFESRFGWHIIWVYKVENAKLPKYEDSKDKLKEALFNEIVRGYLMQSSENAEIKILKKK